ncbi:condensation domain-containing protein [Micromonospora wenchangensis]|uniref:condensation domain-containing protein n=1 Tax=Micromonospora wenchangensis TaxID=1185415 RepID=UPI0033E73877
MTGPGPVAASPASSAQRRIHFLDQLVPDGAVQNITRALDLRGDLDVTALHLAVRRIAGRHESLRTCFATVDGSLRQLITERVPRLRVVDIRDVLARHGAPTTGLVRALTDQETTRAFDLARAPLLRLTLLHTAPHRYVLLMSFHHVIADAWSVDIFLTELAALYRAEHTGEPACLPEPRLQYADYATWQHRMLRTGRWERGANYWREQLRGAPELAVPTDHPRPARPAYRGDSYRFAIDADVTARLGELARAEGATVFMALLAGFAILMHRCTGQRDIVLGGTTSGRDRPEVEQLIGAFVNMLALRIRLDGDQSAREVLSHTSDTCQDAYDHQDVPFEQVVAAHGEVRRPDRHPIFQVVFQMITEAAAELSLPGLIATVQEVDRENSTYDLVCTVARTGERFTGRIDYDTDLFARPSVEALAECWLAILADLGRNPDRPIRELAPDGDRAAVTAVGQTAPDRVPDVAALAGPAVGDAHDEVLDPHGRPAPVGMPGELWTVVGDRRTRTGRLVRQRPDGSLVPAYLPERPAGAADTLDATAGVDATEAPIAAIWCEVLGLAEVGRHDNFFVLGGHSLLATVVVTLLQERLGASLSLAEFFLHPTVAGLAAELTGRPAADEVDDDLAEMLTELERESR